MKVVLRHRIASKDGVGKSVVIIPEKLWIMEEDS